MRKINEIIIHCSATVEGRPFTVEDVRRWHKARGFADVGYHYLIYLDGSVHAGRPLAQVGAHCLGHNAYSIGVCYIGGLAPDGKTPKDTRTAQQKQALKALVQILQLNYPKATVHGHCEFAKKACPCFKVSQEY